MLELGRALVPAEDSNNKAYEVVYVWKKVCKVRFQMDMHY